MNKKFLIGLISVTLSLGAIGCSGNKEKVREQREAYAASLTDSISAVQEEIEECNTRIDELRDAVNGWLHDFTTVTNPREAGSYIILTSQRNAYPLKGTGITARINDNCQFELIAALSGKPFSQIKVNAPEQSATSERVPNDQALNYRTPALTTVMFSGEAADSIGKLIADNELNPLSVTYIERGGVGNYKIPAAEAKMISYTYLLYSNQRELNRLERRVPMLHEKLKLLRAHRDNSSEKSGQEASGTAD
ncbi:MAG: hypothetical protein K2M87_02445 [Muribaculaceae bacterium]|nr:hypothetical protein [Muribaculaceae bacterium]